MKHSDCIKFLPTAIDKDTLTVTNLSSNARMWAVVRDEHPSFYGLNMGLCLPFAVGLALAFPKRRILALDGDGSLMLETSSLITAAEVSPPNLMVIVFDNGNYTDMGETATSRQTDLEVMAKGAGFPKTATLTSSDAFEKAVRTALAAQTLTFLVAKVEREKEPLAAAYTKRTERGMKEHFVDTIRRFPDYGGTK